ncbi:TetR family transcriptional regulator [Lentilactobacillus sunkii]|uniref:HTH tetR-type domain-containing protein n=1 Tax=Lentilactobacillus sunkii DSM 19904 TaxID=1423808 RepID=A0A0R1KVV4_9LACO|nr:TetR family transcriptional regulator [Lentilactobacillus sunkii]KRK87659.1 hypothetical protein FD17_GL000875 [Lentilactobacillus sunkii DSM 19904]
MTDLRTKRTDRAIQQAFIQLVNQEGFQHVTVTDIATEAMINRQTFYKHYVDKYALAETMIKAFADEYAKALEKRLTINHANLSFEDLFTQLSPELQELLGERERVIALLTIQTNTGTLEQALWKVASSYFKKIIPREISPLEQTVLSSLSISVLTYVMHHNHVLRPEEIHEILVDILTLFPMKTH